MVPIRYWRMVLGNITPKASNKDVEVLKVAPRYKRDAQNQPTEILDGYALTFLALKGTDQLCKLPLSAKPAVEELQKLLEDGQSLVRVRLKNPVMRPYALNSSSNGNGLLTGISMSADGFEVTSVEKIDDIDDEMINFE